MTPGLSSRQQQQQQQQQQQSGAPSSTAAVPSLPKRQVPTPASASSLAAPPFTVSQIRAAIPPSCFRRSYLRSFLWLAHDLALVAAILFAESVASATLLRAHDEPLTRAHWAATLSIAHVAPRSLADALPPSIASATIAAALPQLSCTARTVAAAIVFPAIIYALGTVLTGVWVLAHECGHQAFSPSRLVNDAVGLVLHSALLVPYHSWRVSHGKHHANTNSVENDEVFVPTEEEDVGAIASSPIANLLEIITMLLFGWPAYLIANVAGPKKYAKKGVARSHFNPNAALFSPRDWLGVVVSDAALVAVLAAVGYGHVQMGHAYMMRAYWLPYLVVNAYLVTITYLQHTDVYVPHYKGQEWNWLRGALATVDRSYGKVLDHLLHHIADLHVCHHLFSQMPFYNHEEATKAMLPVLGKYYLRDDTPVLKALWGAWCKCKFVSGSGSGSEGVLMFSSRKSQ